MIDVKLVVDPKTGHMLLVHKDTGEVIGIQQRIIADQAIEDITHVTVTFVCELDSVPNRGG